VFPIELSVTDVGGSTNLRYAAFIRDVSAAQRMQRELVKKERLAAVGMGTSVLVHEIGNPLNNMFLSAQAMERSLRKDGHRAHQRSLVITEEIRRLARLLDEFRGRGRQASESSLIDLGELAQEVLASLVDSLQGIGTELAVTHGLAAFRGQRDKLKQVLVNLCKNAIEAMPAGGSLTVGASSQGNQLVLFVQDTGPGIPEGMDVFQPFQTTKNYGTGIGLPVVRQIVESSGGSIDYKSQPEQGTRFTVTLPTAARLIDAPE
jgi:signal transduction histidine kinase